MKKLILTLILVCALCLALAICSFAISYGVVDELDALSMSEEAEIENALSDASQKTGLSFYVGIISGNAEYYSSFKSKYYIYDTNLVLLLIDVYNSEYSYVMHLFGNATSEITASEENKLLDSKDVKQLKKSDGSGLKAGICAFATRATKLATNSNMNWGAFALVVCASVLGGGGIFLLIVIKRYKRKKRGTSYPFDQFVTVDMTDASDAFVTKTITRRRYRSSSSSSSGGRSGGGGGGSRSSSRR